jgi:anti-sigma factor RsiW
VSAHDPWSERLSEYLDGDLDARDAAACAAHVAECGACRTLVEDLQRVADEARALPASPPARDLWPDIATRLAPRAADAEAPTASAAGSQAPATASPPTRAAVLDLGDHAPWWRRRLTLSMPQALAASLLLVALAGGGTWLALRPAARPTVASAPPVVLETGSAAIPATGSAPGAAIPATAGGPSPAIASVDPRYDRTVADLQRLFSTQRAHLDTSTVRILDQNLAIIDRAVADAQRAVEADPSNVYLRSHLAATMRRKVDLLRRATVIAGGVG